MSRKFRPSETTLKQLKEKASEEEWRSDVTKLLEKIFANLESDKFIVATSNGKTRFSICKEE